LALASYVRSSRSGQVSNNPVMTLLLAFVQADDQDAFLRDHLADFEAALPILQTIAAQLGNSEPGRQTLDLIMRIHALRAPDVPTKAAPFDQFMRAADDTEAAALVSEVPELLSASCRKVLEGMAPHARVLGAHIVADRADEALARIERLRAASPLDAALADFLSTESWDEADTVAAANAHLQRPEALARLGEYVEHARARGDEERAQHYEQHLVHLARQVYGYKGGVE